MFSDGLGIWRLAAGPARTPPSRMKSGHVMGMNHDRGSLLGGRAQCNGAAGLDYGFGYGYNAPAA